MQKGAHFLQKYKIFCRNFIFLHKSKISAEIRRKVHTFCRNCRNFIFLQMQNGAHFLQKS
jgi:hypothetical protein